LRFLKHARVLAFLVLAGVTIYGVTEFANADSGEALRYWGEQLHLLPWILLFVCLDIGLEGAAWIWVYQRLGIRARDPQGVAAFLAGRAGLLLPAQLGRLIRPDTLARLGRGSLTRCLEAEATCFVLDVTSVGALLVALAAASWFPWLGPIVAIAAVAVALFLGDVIAERLAGSRVSLPAGFWWRWQTLAIVGVQALGWIAHGVALYVMIYGLPGEVTLWGSVFYSTASSVVGVGSGLPGGIGATEGLLGASLRLMQVPAVHLALAVGAFRLVTFWVWIPVGWIALVFARRRAAAVAAAAAEDEMETVGQPAT
jgi:hypothetical protein